MTDPSAPDADRGRRSLAALTVPHMVELMRAGGSRHASEEAILGDIAAGAPTNADGTMNLVHYVAWLALQDAEPEAARGG